MISVKSIHFYEGKIIPNGRRLGLVNVIAFDHERGAKSGVGRMNFRYSSFKNVLPIWGFFSGRESQDLDFPSL